MNKLDIHKRLKIARKKLNLNQTTVANDLNIQQKTISDIENGKIINIPNSYIYYFYSKGISLEWIYDNKGIMEREGYGVTENKNLFDNIYTNENRKRNKSNSKNTELKKNKESTINTQQEDTDCENLMYERIIDAKNDSINNLQTHIKLQENNMEFLKDLILKIFNKK